MFEVLAHFRLCNAKQWDDTLWLNFKIERDAEINAILEDLRHKKFIDVSKNKMVGITASGRRHLEEQFNDLRGTLN